MLECLDMSVPKEYEKLVREAISYKSISTDPQYKPEIEKMVSWYVNLFKKNSFLVDVWYGVHDNPVIFATYVVDPRLPTILIYGHYDVQPGELSDGWDSEPFTLRIDGDRWFGRGVIDNKGQHLIHVHTVLNLIKAGKLAYNVKFLIEGNEESGGEDLADFVREHKSELTADCLLVSDGEILADFPVIEVSFRGGINCRLTYKTLKNNLHSGLFGGVVPNAAHELAKLISKMFGDDDLITIPGFYDDVLPVNQEDNGQDKTLIKYAHAAIESTGAKTQFRPRGFDYYVQTGLQPCVEVSGISGGYIGEGYANIVPATAEVKINIRLTPNQDPDDVINKLRLFIKLQTPTFVDWQFSVNHAYPPVKIATQNDFVIRAKTLLEEIYRSEVIYRHVGGSIPILLTFQQELGMEPLSISLANEDCNMHGVNENFRIDLIEKGLMFSEQFFTRK